MEQLPEEDRERFELLERIDRWMEVPMLALAIVWLVLLIYEFVASPSPDLATATTAIWIVFILHFLVQFTLAPRKLPYLRRNWLTLLSLAVPALRIARFGRILQALRAARGLRLIKVVGSLNRGMRALGASMGRRGFAYVVALTVLVTVVGAAGMYAFEHGHSPAHGGYGDSLWWTAMIMTTMGTEYWPQTAEGRLLCFLLSLYAFAVFGYVTATLATFFIGRDAENASAEVAGERRVQELRQEIASLRGELAALRTLLDPAGGGR